MTEITSLQNPLIKEIVTLQNKAHAREQQNIVIIEGQKECSVAAAVGVKFQKILFCPDIVAYEKLETIFGTQLDIAQCFELSQEAFAKIAYRENTGGIVAIAAKPHKILADLPVNEQSVFIVLESVEKPGNLGAICRVADAAQVSGIIVCDPRTDIYNPNAIRASLGCVFTQNVVTADFEQTLSWLKTNKITSFAAELTAAEYYHKSNLLGKIALVFGTEATGLTEQWIAAADHRIKIPMRGTIDSLNVNTSVAIIVFEAIRQRERLS
jgi:TrmH family RNA methyltransferase